MWSEGNQSNHPVTNISNLKTGVSGQVTIGIVVAKKDGNQVAGKNGEERGALSFTVRDKTATVNVTYWGTFQFIQQLAQKFHINDVVKLVNCNVQEKAESDQERIYNPVTSASIRITLDQKNSRLELQTYGCDDFADLIHKPCCQDTNFTTLDQIINPQFSYVGRFVNCLAIVKTIPSKRDLVTKTGRPAICCEFEIIDNSKEVVRFVTWLESLADLTYSLVPKQTILFLYDVKVKMDTFTETISLEANSRTIITVNPDIKPAHTLYAFALKLPDEILQPSIRRITSSNNSKVSLNSITREMTIEEILSECPESGVLRAVLTKFDCTDLKRSVSKRCTGCQKKVPGLCAKPECFGKDVVPFFDFTVSLTDHTGTTDNVKLSGECAEMLVGVPVSVFEDWSADMMRACMDRVQLERYKLVFTTFTMPSGIWLHIKQVDSWVSSIKSGS